MRKLIKRIILWALGGSPVPQEEWVIVYAGSVQTCYSANRYPPERFMVPDVVAGVIRPGDVPTEVKHRVYEKIDVDFNRKVVLYQEVK